MRGVYWILLGLLALLIFAGAYLLLGGQPDNPRMDTLDKTPDPQSYRNTLVEQFEPAEVYDGGFEEGEDE